MSEVDNEGLHRVFDVDDENLEENIQVEIETFREVLKKADNPKDPESVLAATITKAANFIDMIEREASSGNMSARYMEVAAALVNAVISASNSLSQREYNQTYLEVLNRRNDLKEKQLSIKEKENEKLPGGGGNTNVLITDTRTLLQAMESKNKKSIKSSEDDIVDAEFTEK